MRHSREILPIWALSILLPSALAHVRIEQPVPYGNPPPNTNPLLEDGSDWPCKYSLASDSLYKNWDVVQWNVMAIGSTQPLSFQGQATHGGGACQISLTKDVPPTKDSVFKVIKSIEGGCPSTNPGNVGTDPFGYGADKFQYTIPNEIAPANYTLAWTWFNKDGNREMYMNCAPITVTAGQSGGSGKRHLHERRLHERRIHEQRSTDGFDSLPDMFRANSGNGCTSPPSGNVLAIPQANLGSNVQRIGSEPLVPPVGSCGGQGSDSAGAGQATSAASSPSQTAAAPSSTPPVASSSAAAAATSSAPSVPATTPIAAASSAFQASPLAAAAPSAAPAGAQGENTGSCPTPGKSVCSPDGKSWGTCMESHQVIYQPIAEGTKCDASLGVEVPLV